MSGSATSPALLGPRPAMARLAWFAVAVLGALAGIATLWMHLTGDPLADVRAYYDAGARLNAGQPLYPPGADTNVADFYRYPPLLAIVFRPLAMLPYPAAAAAWEAVVLAAFVLTLRRLGIRRFETWIAVGTLGLPIGWVLAIGQAQAVVTFLLALGSPLGVALAANLKLFPVLAALFWLGRREWPALARLGAWLAGLAVAQLLLEPSGSLDFLRVTSLDQVGEVRNFSPYVVSPVLWAGLLVVGIAAALRLAPGRWGWAAAVSVSVLAPPRLLSYMLMTLLACLAGPRVGHQSHGDGRSDVGPAVEAP